MLLDEGFPASQAHTKPPTHLLFGNSLPHLDSIIYVHVLSFRAGSLFASPQPSPRRTLFRALGFSSFDTLSAAPLSAGFHLTSVCGRYQ